MTITMTSITSDEAREIGEHVLFMQEQLDMGHIAVAVVDAAGDLLFAVRQHAVPAPIMQIAINKAITAVKFGEDTVNFRHKLDDESGEWVPGGWSDLDVWASMKNCDVFCPWAGGTRIGDPTDIHTIGGVGVSGLDELEDHELSLQRPSGPWADAAPDVPGFADD